MEMRYPSHPEEIKTFTTEQLREEFVIPTLFVNDQVTLVYSHIDRIIVGGACPTSTALALTGDPKELGAAYFLERREAGIINVGGAGTVTIDGTVYPMAKYDGLYVGKGAQSVEFASDDPSQPAHFYITSTPAHADQTWYLTDLFKADGVRFPEPVQNKFHAEASPAFP